MYIYYKRQITHIFYMFMKLFCIMTRQGLCELRTTDNADKFKKPLVVAFYDVDYDKNEKGTNYWRNRYGNSVLYNVRLFEYMCI